MTKFCGIFALFFLFTAGPVLADSCQESKSACMKSCEYETYGCKPEDRASCMTTQFECRNRCVESHPCGEERTEEEQQ